MLLIATLDTLERGLCWSVVCRHETADRTCPARALGRHGQNITAQPGLLVFKLTAELEPSLVEDGAIESRFGADVPTRLIDRTPRRPGHVPNLQFFYDHHRVVVADSCRRLMQEVAADMANLLMDSRDLGFRLLPVVAELGFTGHDPLVAGKACVVLLEAIDRLEYRAIRQRGEAGDAHIDADHGAGGMHGRFDFPLGLDRHVPAASRLADGDILGCAENVPAVAVADPAQLRQEDPTVDRIDRELLGSRIAEAVVLAFLLEAREGRPLGEEVAVGPLQILERLLQRMHRRIGQPRGFRAVAPLGEQLAQPGIAQLLLATLVALPLHRQRLVVDEATRPGEAAQTALLFTILT